MFHVKHYVCNILYYNVLHRYACVYMMIKPVRVSLLAQAYNMNKRFIIKSRYEYFLVIYDMFVLF